MPPLPPLKMSRKFNSSWLFNNAQTFAVQLNIREATIAGKIRLKRYEDEVVLSGVD